MPRNERRQRVRGLEGVYSRGMTDCCAPASYYCGVPSSTETKQTDTHLARAREKGRRVCQRANPAVAVVRYSWCRAGGFIRAAVGCVCCWAVMCCVRAGHMTCMEYVAAGGSLPGQQARTTSKPHLV